MPNCIICASDNITFAGVGKCNHIICSVCFLRLRSKSKDFNCTICKTRLDFVIVYNCANTKSKTKTFEDFGVAEIDNTIPILSRYGTADIDYATQMLFCGCTDHYKKLQDLRSEGVCPFKQCKERFSSLTHLEDHLRKHHHGLKFCKLCLNNRRLFLSENKLMSDKELKIHMDSNSHPPCPFCSNAHFFDLNDLFHHLRKDHMSCHLCPAAMQHRFYKDINSLSTHINEHHFLCPHCELEGNLSGFNNHTEFVSHLQIIHGVNKDLNKLLLAFQQKTSNKFPNNNTQISATYFDFSTMTTTNSQAQTSSLTPPAQAPALAYGSVPRNMKIAGRVTSTGRFIRDSSDERMQACIDESHATHASITAKSFAKVTNATLHDNKMKELHAQEFPDLGLASSSRASAHPMSMVKSLQQSDAIKRSNNFEKEKCMQEDMSKRQSRAELLAEAFGVKIPTFDHLLQYVIKAGEVGASANAGASGAQFYSQMFKMPLYPSALLSWGRNNRKDLLVIEKRLHLAIADKDANSLQLKPMQHPSRTIMHALAIYYGMNSFEFEKEPKRYVSLVKQISSSKPELSLSSASEKTPVVVPPAPLTEPKKSVAHEHEIYLAKRRPAFYISCYETSPIAITLVTANIASTTNNKKFTASEVVCCLVVGEILNVLIEDVKSSGLDISMFRILSVRIVGQSMILIEFESMKMALDVFLLLSSSATLDSLGCKLPVAWEANPNANPFRQPSMTSFYKDIYKIHPLFSPEYELSDAMNPPTATSIGRSHWRRLSHVSTSSDAYAAAVIPAGDNWRKLYISKSFEGDDNWRSKREEEAEEEHQQHLQQAMLFNTSHATNWVFVDPNTNSQASNTLQHRPQEPGALEDVEDWEYLCEEPAAGANDKTSEKTETSNSLGLPLPVFANDVRESLCQVGISLPPACFQRLIAASSCAQEAMDNFWNDQDSYHCTGATDGMKSIQVEGHEVSPNVNDDLLSSLLRMGFETAGVAECLLRCATMEEALEFLSAEVDEKDKKNSSASSSSKNNAFSLLFDEGDDA